MKCTATYMKRSTSILFFLLYISHCFSQSTPDRRSDLLKNNLSGAIESIKETKYSVKEVEGRFIKDTITDNQKVSHYNNAGYLTEEITFELNGTISEKWNYTYDISNNQLGGKRYNNDGNLLWHYDSKFDNKGNQLEIMAYEEGSLVSTTTMKYDSRGNCVEISTEEEGIWKTIRSYDSKDNLMDYKSYDREGKQVLHEIFKYDSKGNLIEKIKYNVDDTLIGRENYSYNSKKQLIEYKYFSPGGRFLERNTYKYDNKGNQIELRSYRADGGLAWKTTYKYIYDKKGNWIQKTQLTNDISESITDRVIKYF